MEIEDGPVYSCYLVCDYNINESAISQPDMPEPSFFKKIWYGFGRLEALYQINHTAIARAIRQGNYNDIVFSPKLKPEFVADAIARKFAREHVEKNLKRLGFLTFVNKSQDTGQCPDTNVHVPLNTVRNINRMRIFGPFMMFDKKFVLSSAALSQRKFKTK